MAPLLHYFVPELSHHSSNDPSVTLTDNNGITHKLYTTCKVIQCPTGSQLDPEQGKLCISVTFAGKCSSDNEVLINGMCISRLDPDKTPEPNTGECI